MSPFFFFFRSIRIVDRAISRLNIGGIVSFLFHPLTPCSTLFIFPFLSDYSNFRVKKLVRFSKDRFLFLSLRRESWDKHQRSSVERAIEAKVEMEGGISLLLLSMESRLLTPCSTLFIFLFLSDYSNLRVKKLILQEFDFSFEMTRRWASTIICWKSNRGRSWDESLGDISSSSFDLVNILFHAFLFIQLFEFPKKIARFSKDRFLFRHTKRRALTIERVIEIKVEMKRGIFLLLSIESHSLTLCSTFFDFIILFDYSNLRVKKLAISPRIDFSFDEENHEPTSVNDHPSREQ